MNKEKLISFDKIYSKSTSTYDLRTKSLVYKSIDMSSALRKKAINTPIKNVRFALWVMQIAKLARQAFIMAFKLHGITYSSQIKTTPYIFN